MSAPSTTAPATPSTRRPRPASASARPLAVHDPVAVLEATLGDRDRQQVQVTIIRPGTSANGLRYPDHVLADSAPLWEGAAAFLDHPHSLDLTRAGQRSLRDLVGVYSGVRYD